jgi:hypothetical protein
MVSAGRHDIMIQIILTRVSGLGMPFLREKMRRQCKRETSNTTQY